ncbi:response regulator [Sphingomonas xinjiangensis]|uniref:histidine kinase n=1 Tax=Sphingomonas xinjiangensis TaxID=643568 RepID=A0A840YPA0_9SPHN|nr:response regulator [Sphingomonas xinjiangensis]MBB5709572.1 signal transduction histidine kinase [Sphingomonas xinjiangensis]
MVTLLAAVPAMEDAAIRGSVEPGMIWTDVITDAVTGLSFLAILAALLTLAYRRGDVPLGWPFWCLVKFLMAYGLVHLLASWSPWQSIPVVETALQIIATFFAVATAGTVWALLSRLTAMPRAGSLADAHAELAAVSAERDSVLAQLRGETEQRRQAEVALLRAKKLEAAGLLTGGIAHDFNNLLQAIAGNLELIARKADDPDRVVRWSASALDAVERGRAVTGQLLAFSRRQQSVLAPVRLVELIAGVRELAERAVAPLAQVAVEPIDTSWNVQVDALQLELAILNLAFNAREAMPDGGVLTLSAEQARGSLPANLTFGDYIALHLTDTGRGMSKDAITQALEPLLLQQEDGGRAGMGVSMASEVLRRMGGAVAVESREGEGTRVTLYLPVANSEPPRAPADKQFSDARVDLSGVTIALVDDDPQVRATLAETLAAAGAEVLEAGSGADGVTLVQTRNPDILIVDFAMPGMSGAEVAGQVREHRVDLPILVATGFADAPNLERVRGARPALLRKPFDSHELLRRLSELLGRHF